MAYRIVPDLCVVCDACRLACPRNAISAHVSEKTYVINADLCNDCVNMSAVRCVPQCPVDAIVLDASFAGGDD
jgi:ferredoxin